MEQPRTQYFDCFSFSPIGFMRLLPEHSVGLVKFYLHSCIANAPFGDCPAVNLSTSMVALSTCLSAAILKRERTELWEIKMLTSD